MDMETMFCPEAVITLTLDLAEGWSTGIYTLIVTDYVGNELYRRVIESPDSDAPVFDYINRKFTTNSKRFKNIKATLSRETGTLKYYGLDKNRIKTVIAEAPPNLFDNRSFECGSVPIEFL